MPSQRRRFHKRLLTTLLVIAVAVVVMLAVAAYAIDARLPQYRALVADRIGQQLHAEVRIDGLDLRWNWQGPTLRVSGVHMTPREDDQAQLRIPVVDLQFALTDLLSGSRLPRAVIVRQPQLAVTIDPQAWPAASGTSGGFDWAMLAAARDVLETLAIDDARIEITVNTARGAQHIALRQFDARMQGDGHTLHVTVTAQASDGFDAMTLDARIDGSLSQPQQARLNLVVDNLAVPAIVQAFLPQLPAPALAGGHADLHLTGRWTAGHFEQAKLRIDTTALRLGDGKQPLLPAMKVIFAAHNQPQQPRLVATLQSVSSDAAALQAVHASAQINTTTGVTTVRVGDIAMTVLAPLLRASNTALAQAQFAGHIALAELTLAPDQAPRAAIAFQQLGVTTPRFATGSVSGVYYRMGNTNMLRFNDAGGAVRLQRYLQGDLPIDDLGGTLQWQTDNDATRVQAKGLKLVSNASAMTLNGSLVLPVTGAPVADLTTHITTPDCSVLLAHVPQAKDLPFDRLRFWLPDAIEACNVVVDGRLHGPLDQMFADDGKHLDITIAGTDFTMEYKPGWPRLTDAAGTIKLNGDTLDIALDSGKILGVAVDEATIKVANVREPVLFLDGKIAAGPAATMLSFLAKSPLRDRFGKLVDVLDVDGEAGLALKLRLPLKDGLGEIKVDGTIHANGNSIGHAILPAPIKAVNGTIHFSRKGLRAEALHGKLMGVALTAAITPAADGRLDIVSRGQIALPQNKALLAHYMPDAWLGFGHGSTQLQAQLQIDMQGNISNLSLHSTLRGMAITLPPPLAKPAPYATALDVHIMDAGRVTVDYGDIAHVVMHFEQHKLRRAVIELGTGDAAAPPGPGIWLTGQIGTLPLQAWLEALPKLRDTTRSAAAKSAQKTAPLRFLGADLTIDSLRLGTRTIQSLALHIRKLGQREGWQIEVNGRGAQGQVTWRTTGNGGALLRGRFSHVRINAPARAAKASTKQDTGKTTTTIDFDPALLPAVDLVIDQLYIGRTPFGRATIQATTLQHGWQLQQASLSGGALQVRAGGQWTRNVGLTRARLNLRIEGHGLSALMQALGFEPAIRAQKVTIQGALKIAGNDNGLDPAALNGKLSLALADGVITSIEPGASRLLGLLNLYVLPRRLMLDFSDVVNEGLEFDHISGDFKIFSGDAFTDNLVIETPSAQINIVGRIGLATRDYDQTVTIAPKIDSSLTLAGTVLGGPIVGAAVFALQQLLETPLDRVSSITYQLQGSWDDPEIVDPRAKD